MKVLHVVVAGEVGGAERMLADLAKDPNTTHGILLLHASDRLRDFFVREGVTLVASRAVSEGLLPFLGRCFGEGELSWALSEAQRFRPDVLHLHTVGSQVFGTRLSVRLRIPFVRTEHSTRAYDDPSCVPFSRYSLARAAHVCAISEHIREVLLRSMPHLEGRSSVVVNGISTEQYEPIAPAEEHGLRLVSVARFDRRKGLDITLRALAEVPGPTLDLIGDGSEEPRLRRIAETLGLKERVTFHGYRSDPWGLVGRANAFVATPRTEGLGIAVIEAMALGKPAVVSPVGGLREVVAHGETGWMSRSPRHEDIVEALHLFVSERRVAEERGELARKRILLRYTVESMRAGYRAVYRRVSPA